MRPLRTITRRLGAGWRDRALRTKVLAALALPILSLGIIATTSAFTERDQTAAQARLTEALNVGADLQRVLTLLVDAETGVRGYLLTGDRDWLQPYVEALERLPDAQTRLAAWFADEPEQARRLVELNEVIDRRLTIFFQLAQAPPIGEGGLDPATTELLNAGKDAMDDIRARVATMQAEGSRDAALRRDAATAATERSRIVGVIALLIGLGGGLVSAWILSTDVVGRIRRLDRNARLLLEGHAIAGGRPSRDEVGRLEGSLLEAGQRLAERERALQEAQASLEGLIRAGPTMIFRERLDDWTTTYVSANVERVVGVPAERILGIPNWWAIHGVPDEIERIRARLIQAAARGEAVVEDEWRVVLGGDVRWFAVTMHLEYDEAGTPVAVLNYAADVTERKRAADALSRALAEVNDLYHNSPCGYHSLDARGVIQRINDTELRWLGYEREEIVGRMNFRDLLAPASQLAFDRNFPRFMATGTAVALEYELVRKDGSTLDILLNATAIRDAVGNVVASRSTLVDITDRRRAEVERAAAQAEAESANRAKSEFLSRMSHELRTPLNSVIGFAQLLGLSEIDSEQREYVRFIERGGAHLLELINEVLDISRIETGRMAISPEPVRVGELVGDVLALVRPLADARSIRIEAASEACEAYVLADRQRLRQVLLNLLSNAVKYNRDAGSIGVSCEAPDADRLRIVVTDTGPGIPVDLQDRLFQPFDRLGAEATGIEGTGMGLAVSKALVEAMGGTIGVTSERGHGSSFWVDLGRVEGPLTGLDDEPVAGAAQATDGRIVDHADRHTPLTVLHIEDNVANQRLVERLLARRPGVTLLVAQQGSIGLQLAREHRPDLVMLDLHLPDLPGDEVFHRLRAAPETRDIPIVVISADATGRQTSRLLALGARAYLTKPLDVSAFLAVLDDVAARTMAAGAVD